MGQGESRLALGALSQSMTEAFDILPTAVVVIAADTILYANPAAWEIFEASSGSTIVGHSVHEFIHPLDQERVVSRIRRAEAGGVRNPTTEFRIYTKKRNLRVIGLTSCSVPVGERVGVLATFLDMTARSAMEQRLLHSDEQFQRLMNTMQDVFYRTDVDGITRYVCPSVVNVLGYQDSEIVGLPAAAFYPNHEDRKALIEAIKAHGYVRDFPGQMRCKDGRIIDISISSTVIYDENGQFAGVEGIWRDITERRALERRLERLASTDELTKLPNRRVSLDVLEKCLDTFKRTGTPTGICIVDLDHFKRINDAFGHLAGDKVLQHFAQIVQRELRKTDHFGRLGGEEFLLILHDTEAGQLEEMGRRIVQNVAGEPFPVSDKDTITITVSMGVTILKPSDEAASAVLSRADAGLYAAKRGGRNRLCWHLGRRLR
ncbi:diguanylate cyclase [Acidiferrobacter sp.]|uniref:GGDEF domain-containing protein n=1 Tax=Acidiferrobacter sp. TaxID=1872107 RepID=UPI002619A36F|nr:GGDEF domain-containing protein [Acidiferrobacter sp.]